MIKTPSDPQHRHLPQNPVHLLDLHHHPHHRFHHRREHHPQSQSRQGIPASTGDPPNPFADPAAPSGAGSCNPNRNSRVNRIRIASLIPPFYHMPIAECHSVAVDNVQSQPGEETLIVAQPVVKCAYESIHQPCPKGQPTCQQTGRAAFAVNSASGIPRSSIVATIRPQSPCRTFTLFNVVLSCRGGSIRPCSLRPRPPKYTGAVLSPTKTPTPPASPRMEACQRADAAPPPSHRGCSSDTSAAHPAPQTAASPPPAPQSATARKSPAPAPENPAPPSC